MTQKAPLFLGVYIYRDICRRIAYNHDLLFRTDPPTSESFKSKFLRNRKNADGTYGLETIDSSSIDAEVKGIYFGAKWVRFYT